MVHVAGRRLDHGLDGMVALTLNAYAAAETECNRHETVVSAEYGWGVLDRLRHSEAGNSAGSYASRLQ